MRIARGVLSFLSIALASTVSLAQHVADESLPKLEMSVRWKSSPDVLEIDIAQDGSLAVGKEVVEYKKLAVMVAKYGRTEMQQERIGGKKMDVSQRMVLFRAHRDVPAGVVRKVIDLCTRQGVRMWKLYFAAQGGEALPLYVSKVSQAAVAHNVHANYEPMGSSLPQLGKKLEELAADPKARMKSPDNPGATELRPVRVRAVGSVPFGKVLAAVDRAQQATFADVHFSISMTGRQNASWRQHGDLGKVVEETPKREVAVQFRLSPHGTPAPSGTWNTAVGLGGAGGKFGGRGGGRRGARGQSKVVAESIGRGLEWLKRNQREDGGWSLDADSVARIRGVDLGEVGVSGLALLAFLGDGSTMRSGPHKNAVKKCVKWLREQQDPNTGRYRHAKNDVEYAIATWGLVEAYGLSSYKILKKNAQLGIDAVSEMEPSDDPVLDAWRLMALSTAKDFRLTFSAEKLGKPSDGKPAVGDVDVAAEGAQLFCDILRGAKPADYRDATRRILRGCPKTDAGIGSLDPMGWYFGSYALYQVGGNAWRTWSRPMSEILPKAQKTDSKNPKDLGAWSIEDGDDRVDRAFATATMSLTLEAYYRYTRMVR